MVTAESLNFDVLQIIFSYLSIPDLASVSQVNQSFLAGALPGLYRSLNFYHNQAKRYPRIVTPFAVVKAHPDLAAHVQNIDIRVVPNTRLKQITLPDPRFLHDCVSALQVSDFITSFTCTINSALPPLLPFIQSKPRLHTLRIEARLTEEQTKLLCQLRELYSVTLENASSTVMDALPKWADALKSTLEHLTIHTSPHLNRTVLQGTIKNLPKLRALHVIGCLRVTHVDVLSATEYAPLLQSLAFTVIETLSVYMVERLRIPSRHPHSRADFSYEHKCGSSSVQRWGRISSGFTRCLLTKLDFASNLPRTSLTALKHLAVDLVLPSDPAERTAVPHSLIISLLSLTRFTHLASLALRLSDKQTFPTTLIDEMAEMHGTHLRSVRFMGFTLDLDGLENLMGCEGLEKLAISVPTDDIDSFSCVLAGNATLHTLIDVVDHGTHGKRKSLTTDRVGVLLEEVPCLTRVVSENRLWTSRQTPYGPETRLERLKRSRGTGFWFAPPPEAGCK